MEPQKREALAERDTWRLEDLYESDAAWDRAYAAAEGKIRALGAFQGRLADRALLKEALDALFQARAAAEKLYCYAKMRRDEDNNRTLYQGMTDRAQTLLVNLSAAGSYFAPELLALPEGAIEAAIADPTFGEYKVYLGELSRARPHTLSAAEERIVAMAGEMGAAPSVVYDMLCDADMRFPEIEDGEGGRVRLTHANYIPLMMRRDRAVRKAAYEAMYETYRGYSATIPALYAASVKADLFSARTANFQTALQAALFSDAVPEAVYENLIAAVRRHLPGLNRLVQKNGRLIGLEKVAFYDLYVPAAPGKFEINLPFDAAYELVVSLLHRLGPDYQEVLRRARDERWIDPFESAGKTSGAYSWGAYDAHPYVLLNYHEDLDGLQTIAHEMGHSLHTYLSNRAQPYPTADYSLFVAEVASTVNEVLCLMELMDRHPEREAQAYLLYNLLDSYRTTLFRQTMFAEFELEAHRAAERGEPLTVENLNALYAGLNRAYYESVEESDLIAYEWMRIPHFYRAFYVYQYATGFSSAMAIAGMIRAEGAPAVERYKRFLSTGGSLHPIEALKIAGVDFTERPGPVDRALDIFEELLQKYEQTAQ